MLELLLYHFLFIYYKNIIIYNFIINNKFEWFISYRYRLLKILIDQNIYGFLIKITYFLFFYLLIIRNK